MRIRIDISRRGSRAALPLDGCSFGEGKGGGQARSLEACARGRRAGAPRRANELLAPLLLLLCWLRKFADEH
jgi:hypothetical protein